MTPMADRIRKPRTAIELIAEIQEHLLDIEGGKDVRSPAEIARVALNAIERWEPPVPYGHGEPDPAGQDAVRPPARQNAGVMPAPDEEM